MKISKCEQKLYNVIKFIGTQFPETASWKKGQWFRPHWRESRSSTEKTESTRPEPKRWCTLVSPTTWARGHPGFLKIRKSWLLIKSSSPNMSFPSRQGRLWIYFYQTVQLRYCTSTLHMSYLLRSYMLVIMRRSIMTQWVMLLFWKWWARRTHIHPCNSRQVAQRQGSGGKGSR